MCIGQVRSRLYDNITLSVKRTSTNSLDISMANVILRYLVTYIYTHTRTFIPREEHMDMKYIIEQIWNKKYRKRILIIRSTPFWFLYRIKYYIIYT